MVSALAAIPIEDIGIPLVNSILPIILLFTFQVIVSFLAQKSKKARAVFCGRPSILIKNGKILRKELRKMPGNKILELLRPAKVFVSRRVMSS